MPVITATDLCHRLGRDCLSLNLPAAEVAAQKDGEGLVRVGYTYATMGDAERGIA